MKTIFTIAIIICTRCNLYSQFNINSISSGNWNNPSVWSSLSVPTISDNVTIASANSVTINANSFCNNLVINNNGILNSDSGIVLNVKGNWANSGNYNSKKGTIAFNGATQQSIGGASLSTFNNLEINNTNGVILSANESVKAFLTITQGTFTTSGFQFTLLSNTITTASIKPLFAGADIAGNITMQRYLSSSATGWRFLGSPVRTKLTDWSNDFITSGFPGSTNPNFNFCSIYSYDETVGGPSVNGYVMPANVTDSIKPGIGYWCWIGSTPSLVDVTGPVAKFNQTFNVSLTPSAGKSEDGWNMLANPYPSAIDWDSPSWTKVGLQNAIYIWDPSLQQYSSYINGIATNGGSNIIPSSQAFWLQANQNNPILSCTEEIKTSSDKIFMRTTPKIPLKLILTGNGFSDETVVSFSSYASLNFNSNEDATKLFSDNPLVPSISSLGDSSEMVINSLPLNSSLIAVPIKVKVGVSGVYVISKDLNFSLPLNSCVYLEDLLTGAYTDLKIANSYSFNINDTTSTARFLLHVGQPLIKTGVEPTCSYKQNGKAIIKINNALFWNATWKDKIGNTLSIHSNNQYTDTLKNLSPGIYNVTITGLNGCAKIEDSIVVNQTTQIMVNTSVADNNCNNQQKGTINVNLVTGAQAPYKYNWSNNDTTALIQNLASGIYTLILNDSRTCSDTSLYIVKTLSYLKAAFDIKNDTNNLYIKDVITFSNQTIGGSTFTWDFGDGSSNLYNPIHIFSTAGIYTVSLKSNDANCTSSFQKIIKIKMIDVVLNEVSIFNSESEAFVKFNLSEPVESVVNVYTIDGKKINTQNFSAHTNTEKVMLGENHGIYIVQVKMNGETFQNKVIK